MVIAWFGHSGSQTSQLMHSSVIIRAMGRSLSGGWVGHALLQAGNTEGATNLETSPPRVAISRMKVLLTNR